MKYVWTRNQEKRQFHLHEASDGSDGRSVGRHVGSVFKVSGGYDSFDLHTGKSRMLDFQTRLTVAKKVLLRAVQDA